VTVPDSGEPPERWWRFYVSATGTPVVANELDSLGQGAKAALADTMKAVARGVGLPREDEKVDDELRVIHVTYDGCEYRVLYGVLGATGRVMLAVHAFNKKSPRLSPATLKKARNRLRDWNERGERSKQT